MPATGGYRIVAQLTRESLLKVARAGYDQQILPHRAAIPTGLAIGPLAVADGEIGLPRSAIDLAMAVVDNGLTIVAATHVQIQIQNPAVPCLTLIEAGIKVEATAPLAVPTGVKEVVLRLADTTRAGVRVAITTGDPIGPIRATALREVLHQKYEAGAIPAWTTRTGVVAGPIQGDLSIDTFDDDSKPNHRITVAMPAAGQVEALIPVHLRLNDHDGAGPSPVGVVAKIALRAGLGAASGSIATDFAAATVTVGSFAPSPKTTEGLDYGDEGAHFTAANTSSGGALEAAIRALLIDHGKAIAAGVGSISLAVPTVAEVEALVGDRVHAAWVGRPDLPLWTPPPDPDGRPTVVTPRALSSALSIGLSDPGAVLPAFVPVKIPAGKSCAFQLSLDEIRPLFDEALKKSQLDPASLPKTTTQKDDDGEDREVRINSLSYSFQNGHILFEGNATAIDVTFLDLDVDVDFKSKIGFTWKDDPETKLQTIDKVALGNEIDVDDTFVEALEWIVSALGAYLTGFVLTGVGLFGVLNLAEILGESIGSDLIKDPAGKLKGLGAWPDKLRAIGNVKSRFENPIDIAADGITFYDGFDVVADLADTLQAPARANGPYVVAGGSPLTLGGGPVGPDTKFAWDFGDAATAVGPVVTHTYADDSVYVAKLTVVVDQPGGATTRQFAKVTVTNAPPRVAAGPPITIDEGEEVDFLATFTDAEWPDTHTAIFTFGDDTMPVAGVVVETNAPPEARGTATARHAYCDNGEFVVTVLVRDDDGGFGAATQRVTVRNVPPTVDAGVDMFAYPCTPITLVATFTDPGWCDTHTATWEFGDCSAPRAAVVRERHDPPKGTGTAAAAHIYHRCGTYLATSTVVDDDGGIGQDSTVVRVVEVRNRDFEGGFRGRLAGVAANDWEPYVATSAVDQVAGAGLPGLFAAEEFVVHGGQRSQRIGAPHAFRAGLWQKVGANLRWDYEISAWYHLDERAGGRCRLGVDPNGGDDPASPTIVWSAGTEHRRWAPLVVRVNAVDRAITVFLEADSERGGAFGYFDDVELIASPCPLRHEPPAPPPEVEKVCVGWSERESNRELGFDFKAKGFAFVTPGPQPLQIVTWGPPPGRGKLLLPPKGLTVHLPFVGSRVVAQVVHWAGDPIELSALDAAGLLLGSAKTIPSPGAVQSLAIKAAGIAEVRFRSGNRENLLVELCVERDRPPA